VAIEDREQKQPGSQGDENELRDLIENVPAMMFIALPGPSCVFASRHWRDYVGLSQEETKGLGWQGAVHPEDLQRHMAKWLACSVSDESFEDEIRFRRADDGAYRWFLVRAEPKLDENRRIVKWYGILTDIEDRKQTEQALRQREAHLADAQKLTHTGSWAWNPWAGDLLSYCSDEMYRIFGLDPQDGLPTMGKLQERVHPEERVRKTLEFQLRKDGKKDAPERDYRLVMPNGIVKYIHSVRHSVLDSSGTVIEIVGTAVDVTERTRAEEALRRSEAYLAEAQSLTHTGSFAFSEEMGAWVVRYWSDENMRIWGFDPAHGLPTTKLVRERIHPEDRERVVKSGAMARRAKTDQISDFRILLPDGRVRYIHSTIHSIFRAGEGYMEVVGTHVDVTERKSAEEERERLRLRYLAREFELSLEARVAERTRIARELHDTLLQSFQGLLLRFQTVLDLLLTRPAEAGQILASAIDQAAGAITEGREAVQGLRSSAEESNDLVAAIRTLGEGLRADPANSQAASLRVEVEGAVRALHPIVRDEVYRIAGEAMRNAFQHSRGTHIGVDLQYDKQQLCLRIRDNGKGIDTKVLSEWGRAGHFGLRGMRERADLIGGSLNVRSAPDAGTEVTLTIAAAHAYTKASAARSQARNSK
jgi:PAS domain S-box-containing protein